jgi:hypothetical protein
MRNVVPALAAPVGWRTSNALPASWNRTTAGSASTRSPPARSSKQPERMTSIAA